MDDEALSCVELCAGYGRTRVLHDVTCSFAAGITGVVGVNGAGKTTWLRILAGIAAPQAGRMSWCGRDIRGERDRSVLRASLGYLPQNPHWHPQARVRDMIEFFLSCRGIPRSRVSRLCERALAATDGEGFAGRPLQALSGGQTRRAFLALAIAHRPRVLVLDEPTAGLDPLQRIGLRTMVRSLSADTIVIWATHEVGDLEHAASHIVALDSGALAWAGDLDELSARGQRSPQHGLSVLESGLVEVLQAGGARR
ncbi:ATP-binding cassette domain-containing protein [Nanchangia anserum]|uniref:ATP-binding cassette domain-containing protein n=1 Tax=Nanchangia anserum TaxID=2692125 RepID=A0A8I0KNC4_9ACTO|nr:ATP-binding cassette domain-containing protein [Nanchangia anserum]MBD3689136.1 ATP-binding cassette domain-containing protein [Nanchangia anserum]QOX81370.1 ATP-binding cassette domain-containing protein [Nanchangia anserum]